MSKQHSIRLPGILLDELKDTKYNDDDTRFQLGSGNKKTGRNKRKSQPSRKELRRQQREGKKAKRSGNDSNSNHSQALLTKKVAAARKVVKSTNGKSSTSKVPAERKVRFAEDVKDKKEEENKPFSSDDELSSGDFDEFDEDDLDEEEWKQLRELEGPGEEEQDDLEENWEDGEDDSMSVEETLAKLKHLKAKKDASEQADQVQQTTEPSNASSSDEMGSESDLGESVDDDDDDDDDTNMTVEETMAALKAMKDKKTKKIDSMHMTEGKSKSSTKKDTKAKNEEYYAPLTPEEKAAIAKDEMDMQYYAKKLGLKGSKKIRATDEYDAIGGLLEGLDFIENFGGEEDGTVSSEESSIGGEEDEEDDIDSTDEESEEQLRSEEAVENPFSSDDELSSGDFDEFDEDDLDEDEWKQLRELESSSSKGSKMKENLYAAPTSKEEAAYVPPSLRKKHLDEAESETFTTLKKQIKSSLNKLSDSNTAVIVTSINALYDQYARQFVNDALNNQLIEMVSQKSKLLDSFIMNYASVAFCIWKLRGMEAGASFIQSLVQKFLEIYEDQSTYLLDHKSSETVSITKEATNLITLLAYSYNFGLISSKIIYDVIKELVKQPNEYTTELLLRVISVCGPLIRGDDPRALKEIITELLNNVKKVKQTSRMSFLLETLSDLKNNRLKPSTLAANHQSLKKSLVGALKLTSSSSEPLLVSLEDIKNADTKGKWWLIGASWKGNQTSAFEEAKGKDNLAVEKKSKVVIEDDLLSDIPDWNEIAKRQRMNTDVRRAIFVSIMSAEDYLDAFTKLEKLNLKNKQSLEISRVILHCLSNDGTSNGYNPYYSLLAAKVCEHNHKLLKSFQFLFWELVKKFELSNDSEDDDEDDLLNNDDLTDEDARLRRLSNQGRFFGYLIADGHLKLDIFKHVPLIGGISSDGSLFFEMLFLQMFLSVAKKSEIKEKKGNSKAYSYQNNELLSLIEKGITPENRVVILKALKWFIGKKFKYQKYLSGLKGSNEYQRESRRLQWAIPQFLAIIDTEF